MQLHVAAVTFPTPSIYKIRFTELKPCAHSRAYYCHSVVALTELAHWKMLIPEKHSMFISSSTSSRSLKLTWCSASWHSSLFPYLEWRSQTSRGWTLRRSRDKKQSTKCWYRVTSRIFPLKTSQLSSRITYIVGKYLQPQYGTVSDVCLQAVRPYSLRHVWPFALMQLLHHKSAEGIPMICPHRIPLPNSMLVETG
jgi:hypothetical protein